MWRLLQYGEREEANQLCRSVFAEDLPTVDVGDVYVLDVEGKIEGVAALQMVPHLSDVVVNKPYRSIEVIGNLARQIKAAAAKPNVRGIFAETNNKRVGLLLSYFGFQELNWRFYRWLRRM